MNDKEYKFGYPKTQHPPDTAPCLGGPLDGAQMPAKQDGESIYYRQMESTSDHEYVMIGRRWLYLGVRHNG